MGNILELKDISKEYEGFKLDNINITLPSGYIMGFIGENGAGKSTTIKVILDLIHKDSGTVKILGKDSKELKLVKEDIGVVMDESYLPETLNLKEVNLIMKNVYKKWDKEVFKSYIDRFNLPNNKTIKDYSRGMKMKLAISIALSHDPKLLILDEATSGLDPMVRDEILDVFLEFIRDEQHSIFISSHIISDLEKVCDYITLIHKGKIVFTEEKDNLLEKYGILKCSHSEFEKINKENVKGVRKNQFGVEALVLKRKISGKYVIDPANIEDIMLYHIKERVQ
ncbi:ABC-2 type transport system ATP-binding protein [Natranaerovirga pectinivora]|uniref:ABC-2 type transport system ATP-binding protein n=1 Tax=Natranaerovirga pectinivora TaxID=682400 RepID=A0A4R3MPP3_9FIRM|nr:ABC transporter ATP-binding protein [Natranaerovirga pectinivora]TCT16251.1 ABC-2 type transport system ATP-binding protein [Natranaerovirga pectinivora]